MAGFEESRNIQGDRIDELAQQVRDRYGIEVAENGQKPAVSNVLLFEQLLVNSGFEV